MAALLFEITERREQVGWANLNDFELGPAQVVSARIVVEQAGWSLYGLDKAADVAVFVQLPEHIDLASAAFVYEVQHAQAIRILTVPLGALDELADMVAPPKHVIFIFSIGRCGSTLVANALNAAPSVWSLSEPDAYSTMLMQHYDSAMRVDFPRETVVRLIRACTRLLFRPPAGGHYDTLSVKLKSQSLYQADIFHQALPDAICVFLYRDAISWANSVYQMMRKYDFPAVLTGDIRLVAWNVFSALSSTTFLSPYVNFDAAEVPLELALAPAWAINMQEYGRQLKAGVPFLALRYNEIDADHRHSLLTLFRHCNLPERFVETALASFDHDSQAGTKIARDVKIDELDEAQLARLRRLIDQQPVYNNADLRLADIYSKAKSG